jgi:histidine triad (HIT) family protein
MASVSKSDCLFCKFASGAVPADKVHDDELCFAIRDIQPLAPSHLLIIPKQHIASANELSEADATLLGRIFSVASQFAASEGLSERGYRLVFNTGPDAGQSVFHLHLHLLGGRNLGASVS